MLNTLNLTAKDIHVSNPKLGLCAQKLTKWVYLLICRTSLRFQSLTNLLSSGRCLMVSPHGPC